MRSDCREIETDRLLESAADTERERGAGRKQRYIVHIGGENSATYANFILPSIENATIVDVYAIIVFVLSSRVQKKRKKQIYWKEKRKESEPRWVEKKREQRGGMAIYH